MEVIVAAAIQVAVPEEYRAKTFRGKRSYPDCVTISALPPARHATLLHPIHHLTNGGRVADQGFITSTGRYVDREEGLKIALASGQPMIDHPSRHNRLLFSEDLW